MELQLWTISHQEQCQATGLPVTHSKLPSPVLLTATDSGTPKAGNSTSEPPRSVPNPCLHCKSTVIAGALTSVSGAAENLNCWSAMCSSLHMDSELSLVRLEG